VAVDQELIQDISFRPKCYITIGYVQATITPDDIRKGTVGNKLKGEFKTLGAVQQLEVNSKREAAVWRELNYVTAGKPVESYPGLPSYDVTLSRIVLYESNILEAFEFDDFDIMRQNKPLTLKIDMHDPSNKHNKTWYVYGVWFKSNPMEFEVENVGDLRIVQEVDAVAAGIYSVVTAASSG